MRARLEQSSLGRHLTGHDNLLRGSAWLTLTVAANAAAGFAFWLLAARTYPEEPVGEAAALFTAVLFVNFATSGGLPIAVGRYAPDRRPASAVLFGWSLIVTTVTSAIGTVLFLAIAGGDITAPLDHWGRIGGALVFFVCVTGISASLLVEVRLLALRRWGWVLGRVAVVGLVRLPLIDWNPIGDEAAWLFVLVVLLPALSGLGLAAMLRLRRRIAFSPLPHNTMDAVRFAAVNYAGLLALQAPLYVLPLIVALQVGPTEYSPFYIAFQIATVAFLVPHMLSQVLLVEGGRGPRDLDAQVRVALGVTVGLMAVVALTGVGLARLVPVVYGSAYDDAGQILPILLLAGVPWAITSILITRARVVEAKQAIIGIALCLAVTILVPAAVLTARMGIEGAALAWLGGHVVTAAVAIVVGRHLDSTVPRTPP